MDEYARITVSKIINRHFKVKKILFIAIFCGCVLCLNGCRQSNQGSDVSITVKPNAEPQEKEILKAPPDENAVKIVTVPDNKPIPKNKTIKKPEKKIQLSINKFGRDTPFVPYENQASSAKAQFISSLPLPPLYVPDEDMTDLFSIKVKGILYDKYKPSALVDIKGSEYIIHEGEIVSGYFIKDIQPSKVVIKYKNNIYKAGIGEIVDSGMNSGSAALSQNTYSQIPATHPATIPPPPTIPSMTGGNQSNSLPTLN